MTKFVVVMDIDGPVNARGTPVSDDTWFRGDEDSVSCPGAGRHDFSIVNKPLLQITCELLTTHDVAVVIGSQRIQMKEEDETYGPHVKTMYQGLSKLLGKDRAYLQEAIAKKIGQTLQEEYTQQSKKPLLDAYATHFQLEPQYVLLVDDNARSYKASTEEAGYGFVHAPMPPAGEEMTTTANAYLYETLLRTLTLNEVLSSIDSTTATAREKTVFKQQFIDYVLDHPTEVINWQTAQGQEEPAAVSQYLQAIKQAIYDTQWQLGLLGGVKVKNDKGQTIKVPRGVSNILTLISTTTAEETDNGQALLKQIADSAKASGDKNQHGFFNKRAPSTQAFYQRLQSLRSEEREQHSAERPSTPSG